MEIKQNTIYIADEVSYLCIGFTDDKKQAVLAPYWADDEDCTPDIQNDAFMVVQNPYTETGIEEYKQASGRVVFE